MDGSFAQQRVDLQQQCRDQFDAAARSESDVYMAAIDLIADALDQLLNPRQVVDELSMQEVAAYSIAAYGYQLLLAIWSELRLGRAASAETMVRPAFEAADYMLACLQDGSFVEQWKSFGQGLKIRRARDAAARFMETLNPGAGRRWTQNRAHTHRLIRSAPHVHASTVSGVFARNRGAWSMAPDGHYSQKIRATSVTAARLALDLVSVTRLGFAARLTADWLSEVEELSQAANAQLQSELKELNSAQST